MRRRNHGSSGQATVEMALVLPILIWILLGLVDVARMANAYLIVQHSAREGVRLGITGASDMEVGSRILATSKPLDPTLMVINVSPAGTRNTGSDITVKVSYRYKVLALMGIIGAEVPLSTELTARVE